MSERASAAAEIAGNTPILIGAGQFSEKRGSAGYRALSPTDLAAEAAIAACDDALSIAVLGPLIDLVAAVRTTADSRPPEMRSAAAPFGAPDNVPGVVARRLGAIGARGVYSPACGDEPQKLIGEFAERLHAGECRMVVICGGEATSTVRAALAAGERYDWYAAADNELDDRGPQTEAFRDSYTAKHGLSGPITFYPIFEQARRRRTGVSADAYRAEIGELFAPFTRVAAANPHAFSSRILTPGEIATITPDNRMVSDPLARRMVAREQVNLGAAVVLTTVAMARELGVAESKWVYLHGYAATTERTILQRQDLSTSPAMRLAYSGALRAADVTIGQIRYLDLYSCYPIAVFAAIEALGLAADDPRGLTLTGGLPYFGGPGNNYSMHAIAVLIGKLRGDRGALGLIGANGGLLSTHAVGVYSTTPAAWKTCDSSGLQREIDGLPMPPLDRNPAGRARVESYTVLYDKSGPRTLGLIGRLLENDSRFVANAADDAILRSFVEEDGLDRIVNVRSDGGRNVIDAA